MSLKRTWAEMLRSTLWAVGPAVSALSSPHLSRFQAMRSTWWALQNYAAAKSVSCGVIDSPHEMMMDSEVNTLRQIRERGMHLTCNVKTLLQHPPETMASAVTTGFALTSSSTLELSSHSIAPVKVSGAPVKGVHGIEAAHKDIPQNGDNRESQANRLLRFDELPEWMQVDPYIRRGYRHQMSSMLTCVASLFYIHNEFVNAWSHLLPSLFYVAVLLNADWKFLEDGNVEVPWSDRLFVKTYVACTAICLLCSGLYHTMHAHSQCVAKRFVKLDYLGIILNTAAINVAVTHFSLHGHENWKLLYWAMTASFGVVVFYLVLGPNSDRPKAAVWRSVLFVALAGSGNFPLIHGFVLSSNKGLRPFPLAHTLAMEFFYTTGVAFYLARFPEKRFPLIFDIWGASHQIFHVVVAIGQASFFLGLKQMVC